MDAIISIIMPAYNAAEHLDFSIQSVISQTFKNWELIIIDDGSVDATPQKIRDWVSREPRIKGIRHDNAGVSSARNRGLNTARGEYIFMLDADDAILPHTLEKMHTIMNRSDSIDMVTSGFCEITPGVQEIVHRGGLMMGRKDQGIFPADNGFLAEYMHCSIWGKLLRSAIIRQHNLQFDTSLSIGEDHLFALEYLLKCRKIAVLQEELYQYMQWNQSAISSFETGNLPDSVYINSVTLYANMLQSPNTQWSFALLAHFFRMRSWVKRIITTHRPHDWQTIRKSIDAHLPVMLYKAGLLNSLRMIRRHLYS